MIITTRKWALDERAEIRHAYGYMWWSFNKYT